MHDQNAMTKRCIEEPDAVFEELKMLVRAFTGKGTLVWGARTLAGNDNEWRYVSVRRLFITIEESARKATAFAVFEPNDATTWLKVKAMIESYLYGLWERGALAGVVLDDDLDIVETAQERRERPAHHHLHRREPQARSEADTDRHRLRASHRALDEQRSSALQPYHPHTSESLKDMTPGVPELLRVEMMPFSHVFRKGSSIRMYVENPSMIGLWGFQSIQTPQMVTVHHDAEHPSKIVLGELPNANVKPGLTECGTVDSQPCRNNPVPQP